jgi:Mrp family chromosome partitioning ATPase
MNRLDPCEELADGMAVAFVPPAARPTEPRRTSFADFRLAERIVRELGPGLSELAWRTRQFSRRDRGTFVLLTGNQRGTGCTTVALALAAAAAVDQSVLLIDGDLDTRGLSTRMRATPEAGWEDVLQGFCPLDQAVYFIEPRPGFAFLPLRQPVADPVRLLAQPALAVWQKQLRYDYDLILLDGGSVWTTGGAWAPWIDGALVVGDANHKLAAAWALGWDRLEEGGAAVLGMVETFS